jgi:hypothetical protein
MRLRPLSKPLRKADVLVLQFVVWGWMRVGAVDEIDSCHRKHSQRFPNKRHAAPAHRRPMAKKVFLEMEEQLMMV